MEELDKKLAEWAGIEQMRNGFFWMTPSKDMIQGCPNFTQSLDACFKWLVPKLFAVAIHTIWTSIDTVYKDTYMAVAYRNSDDDYRATELTPALALCKAIEKLIDGEKDAVI